jgi:hypothetical protein
MRSGFFLMLFDMFDIDIDVLAKISIVVFIMCVIASTVFWIWSEYADLSIPMQYWKKAFEKCNGERGFLELQNRIMKAKIEDNEKFKNKNSGSDS